MSSVIHLIPIREVEKDPEWDLRTKEGREAEVLEQVRQHGGFSVYWVTDNTKRAHAADKLEETGVIVREANEPMMWIRYSIDEDKSVV